MSQKLAEWKKVLRKEHSLKHGVDYALMYNKAELRIMCHTVYAEGIAQSAKSCGVEVKEILTFAGSGVHFKCCANCRFNTSMGYCHCGPPSSGVYKWPDVEDDEWCGQWRCKEEKEK